jgi:hypothetical protein
VTPVITYRSVRHYKYQLLCDFSYRTQILIGHRIAVGNDFVVLEADGRLDVKRGYAWDGPSGPTYDTSDFMRASVVHDALYQLMREQLLDAGRWREVADDLLLEICRADGMPERRAAIIHRALRMFGGRAAQPGPKSDPPPLTAPGGGSPVIIRRRIRR